MGLALVTGSAGVVGAGGEADSFPKRRLSKPGLFWGSAIGSGMTAGAATVFDRDGGGTSLGAALGGLVLARAGSPAFLAPMAFGVAGAREGVFIAGAEVIAAAEDDLGEALGVECGAFVPRFSPLRGSGGMWLLSMSVKVSPDFMSLTSDWYEPSGWRSVLTILTFFSGPFSNFSVMTSPTLGGAAGASLPAPSASPTAAVIPNTPVQAHRFQIHRFMADSVQHALPAPSVAAGRQSLPTH
jgi:hypothetical protein